MVEDRVKIVGRAAHGIGAKAFDARLFSRVIDPTGQIPAGAVREMCLGIVVRPAQGDGVRFAANTRRDMGFQLLRRRAQRDGLAISAHIIAKADLHVPVRAHRLGGRGQRLLEQFLRRGVFGHDCDLARPVAFAKRDAASRSSNSASG